MPMNSVVPFGKYRGQPLEALAADPEYCEWLAAQPWFRERYSSLHTIIINNFVAPSQDTPDHNALQARFLDPAFCLAVACHIGADVKLNDRWKGHMKVNINYTTQDVRVCEIQAQRERESFARALKSYEDAIKCPPDSWEFKHWGEFPKIKEDSLRESEKILINTQRKLSVERSLLAEGNITFGCQAIGFEEKGWDVLLELHETITNQLAAYLLLELKPLMGDDYPSVLRQMKANRNSIRMIMNERELSGETLCALVVGDFHAEGATLDQVKAIFAASDFRVLLLEEIKV